MILDSHCHVWPDHIAPQILATRPAGLDPMFDGTVSGLLRTMDDAGIDRVSALGVAGVARNVHRTNAFIGSLDRSRFFPFGTVHPDLPVEENIASLVDHGIVGVKLHPLFQELDLGSAQIVEIAHGLAEHGIPVITHAGAGGTPEQTERGHPRKVRALSEAVPGLVIMACHYGGYHLLDEAEDTLVGTGVILETSWPPTMADLDKDRIRQIVDRHGADRFVFGSDWPMADPGREIAAVRALGLTPEQEAEVLGGTLARVLGV
ncbi:MAG: amidohydrolase family protein [Frankiales bacterium]|nr:amidohydrolase family protein [Frankiales bacterium]